MTREQDTIESTNVARAISEQYKLTSQFSAKEGWDYLLLLTQKQRDRFIVLKQ
ncbi:hypothetical protein [Desulfosporosinus sp.]|uniref:hypothetical protein n=1 Tax=Desulfosporosinus sp. TaxID=157907 RepID=UPI0025B84DE8|nr:hypothetical protein [Desulfosporosinus sp.]MBC2723927.1 hypothetical protein [Desulfosporosinus sp.]MBC2725212.1 hypothetical protein [Desulfosporosinus sp.]